MCNCQKFSFCLGNLIYISEKLATCCALTAVVTCLIITIIAMLVFGIGLGYNYCFVDFKAKRSDEFYERTTFTTGRTTKKKKSLRTPSMKNEANNQDRIITPTVFVDQAKYPVKGDLLIPSLRASKVRRKSVDNTETTRQSPSVIGRTMIVPLHVGVDFSALLSKIRALNKNVTLEIIAS